MLIIGSMVVGVLIFFGLILLTLLLGAVSRESGKEIAMRTEAERRAGITGDVTSETPHPIHDRYLEA
jgi:hypothetical protein